MDRVPLSKLLSCGFIALMAVPSPAYEYDETDPTQGAGAEAAWRDTAQWDVVDETATRAIHEHTTEPKYVTPMVSYIPEDPSVPSPRDVLGYIAGTEGKLTRPTEEIRYFEALAAASPRVRVEEMGSTEEGRTMHLVIVSSEDNLARLDEFKGYTRALTDPRETSPKAAQEIIAGAKPIVHITAGLHSPETGPPEMVMELAYRLAVSKHPDIVDIRDNVIVLITPITDVDGRAKVVDWYYRHLEDYDSRLYMPYRSPPYWGKYVFHDNNRDGLQMTQKLTQNYMDSFMEWHPTYSLDLHESVPLLYVSGGTGPYNRALDPIVIREWQWFAHYELAELQRHNLPGVWTWGFYTGWNPSYLLWITNNHNSLGRFYETFGNLSARTMERDLSEVKFAGKKITEQQWYSADPPDEKVMWSLRNNTNYMQAGVLASLKLVSTNGPTLLENYYQKGVNSLERGRNEAPYGWVIPAEQRDRGRLAYLVNQLQRQGIEVHRATEDFEVGDTKIAADDFVVRLDQPYANFARMLLDTQMFPKDAEHRPYDDVSWKLGHIYRVDTAPIADDGIFEATSLERVTGPVSLLGSVAEGDPEYYAINNTGQNALIRARYRLSRYEVMGALEPFEADDATFHRGTLLIPHRRGLRGELDRIAESLGLDVHAITELPEVASTKIELPRIALYHNWVATQDDGWLRYTLDQYEIPYDYIADYTVKRGRLASRYDVIVMANQGRASAKAMVHGRDEKFGPQAYTRTNDFPSHGYVDGARDISGGIGFEGLQELENFLDDGGTLILLGSAGKLATEMGLVRNVTTSTARVQTPGSTLATKVLRPDHPVAFGFEELSTVFRVNAPLFEVPKHFDHWIVMQYGDEPLRKESNDEKSEEDSAATGDESESEELERAFLLGGYVDPESEIKKKGVIIDVPRHAGGRVLLYSFNPLHRFLNHADFNYFFNALLYWNDFPDPKPKDHPMLVKD